MHCSICGEDVPVEFFAEHVHGKVFVADMMPVVEKQLKEGLGEFKPLFDCDHIEEPEPINLNEIIPYRIKAREEHAALMAAHREREEAAEPSWERMLTKRDQLMLKACGPEVDYDPVPEPGTFVITKEHHPELFPDMEKGRRKWINPA